MNDIDWGKAPEGAEAGYLGTSHAYDAWYKRDANGEVWQICSAAGFDNWVSMGGRKDFPVGSVLRPGTIQVQPEYTGGSVSYYTCSVTHPISETADPYDAECIDIIDALQMTPNEANAFKALWRRAAARLGKSKRGYTDGLYDAEKVEFYGKRLVELERRGRVVTDPKPMPATPAPWPWQEHRKGADAPVDPGVEVEVAFADGNTAKGLAGHYIWTAGTKSRITHWRLPVLSDPFGPRDAEGWYSWNGDDTMRPAGLVDLKLRSGSTLLGPAEAARWEHRNESGDIVKWRPVEKVKSSDCSADCSPGCRTCNSSA